MDNTFLNVLLQKRVHGGAVSRRLGAECTSGRLRGEFRAACGRLDVNRLYRIIVCRE